MAGNGPAPKDPSVRARRNKTSTRATLVKNPKIKAPALPGEDWHEMTLAWWADLWSSPMAPEYDDSDKHGLFILATLVNAFWNDPSKEIAAEIRLQRQCFGLTPIDRRRLQWEIERVDEAQDKARTRRAKAAPAPAKKTTAKAAKAADPRRHLSVV